MTISRQNKNVNVRLDQAVADNSWRNLFRSTKVVHHVSSCSDHLPILLKCEKDEEKTLSHATGGMRYYGNVMEAYWNGWHMHGRRQVQSLTLVM